MHDFFTNLGHFQGIIICLGKKKKRMSVYYRPTIINFLLPTLKFFFNFSLGIPRKWPYYPLIKTFTK